ncbi:MAG TPA: lytic transglycosylase domain-containing protein [Solirubrobacteraceae bacterium]|nr:lytic transglycosylase domain-containing protein [Solirubrobacteraceae bacterium]
MRSTPIEPGSETSTATPPAPRAPAVAVQRPQKTTEGTPQPKASKKAPQPTTAKTKTKTSPAKGANSVALPPQLVAAQAETLAAALAASQASAEALGFYRIPLFLLPIYKAAAARYGVPWQILAAINEIETDYGTDLSVSSAGAVGWMQFMPATWLQYGVDALDAGYADPYNPVDAVFAAARYLSAAGSASDLRSAILAYNHSQAYLESVLLRAKLISSYPSNVVATLTALTDAGMPVTGSKLAWEAPARAAGTHGLDLVRLKTAPNASAVAVQDGRIVGLGKSRRLGRFVVLRDVYGDEFTYAALGHIASSYAKRPQKRSPLAAHAAALHRAIPASAGGRPIGPPITLTAASGSRRHRASRRATLAAARGKVRLYAHPGNPDAIVAAERNAPAPPAGPVYQLRSGAEVQTGTVLGRVNVLPGASEGRISFAIRPAGDRSTIDPRAVLEGWAQLHNALHPQGAKTAEALLGATASAVLTMSRAELQQALLSDPGVTLDPRSRELVAAGDVDRRVLAALAFLSRCGLQPTITLLDESGVDSARSQRGAFVADISAVDGVTVNAHQGSGTLADLTVRTLLAMPAATAPHAIWSLMRYPGAPSTHASTADASRIRIEFKPLAPATGASMASSTGAARIARARAEAAAPLPAGVRLSPAQWDQLIERIAALPTPSVGAKPSAAAVQDTAKP